MIEAIGELLVAIVTAIVELMALLLNLVLSTSWIAAHSAGMARVFHALMALSALHLFTGMVLALSGMAGPLILSVVFNGWVMMASLTMMVIGFTAAIAVDRAVAKPSTGQAVITYLGSYALAFLLIMGLSSIWTAQSERRSLTDRLCAAGEARLSEDLRERGTKALDLAERLLNHDLRAELPCKKAPSQ